MNRGHDIAEKIKVLASSFAVVITAVYVGVLSVSSPNQINAAMIRLSANTANNNNKLSFHNLVLRGSPFLGKFSAPITIVEFGDFQCDRCARFAKYTEPQLNQTYIQTGTANLVFKYFPIYGPDSTLLPWQLNAPTIKENSGSIMIFYSKTKDHQTLVGPARRISRSLLLKYLE